MKDLIERLERASGPDRELDNLIWFSLGQPLPDDCAECPARYTASLDSALSLVPEGSAFRLSRICWHSGRQIDPRYWAGIDGPRCSDQFTGLATSNLATATCIAALKARDFAERDLTKMEAGK